MNNSEKVTLVFQLMYLRWALFWGKFSRWLDWIINVGEMWFVPPETWSHHLLALGIPHFVDIFPIESIIRTLMVPMVSNDWVFSWCVCVSQVSTQACNIIWWLGGHLLATGLCTFGTIGPFTRQKKTPDLIRSHPHRTAAAEMTRVYTTEKKLI
jgi:hypothetical protein